MAPLTAAQEEFAAAVEELNERRRRRAADRIGASIMWAIAAVTLAACASSLGWGGRAGVAGFPAAPFACAVVGAWRGGGRLGTWLTAAGSAIVLAWVNIPNQDLWWLAEHTTIFVVIALFLSAPRHMLPHYGRPESKRIRVGGERMTHFRYAIR